MSETSDGTAQQGQYIQANGLNIYYEEYGSGEPLILLHGATGTGSINWNACIPLLSDGRFFIAGGRTDTAELYSSTTGTWELLGNMAVSRSFHTVTLLANGTVLVSGGENANGFIATAEVYTP
jgi:hypothetical protein